MQKSCIVVPCYNEANRLNLAAYNDLVINEPSVDFLFCNDGSTDSTRDLLLSISNSMPERIKTMDMPQNSGKAEAVRTAVLHAAGLNDYKYIGYWDADLATPLSQVPRLIEELNSSGKKIALCSRVKRLGARVQRNEFRHYLGRVFSTFASVILKLPVYDSQCGAKLFHRDTLVIYNEPFLSKWLFDVELLARFRNHFGLDAALSEIIEVPVSQWKEIPGSKLRFKHYLRVPIDLIKISRFYNRRK